MRKTLHLTLAIASAAVLASCASEPENSGILTVGSGESMHLCLDQTDQIRAAGVTYIANQTQAEIVVKSVELIGWNGDPRVDSYVIPDGSDVYTVAQVIPAPEDDVASNIAWLAREDAAGHSVDPGAAYQLVVATPVLAGESFEGISVTYEADGREYVNRNYTSASVKTEDGTCD